MRIFLMGFMTAGKTTLGRELATFLEWPFVDLDERLETQEGRSIAEIFATEGEARFRQLERQTLESLTEQEGSAIVACGGGLPCFGDNLARMKELGKTVYLRLPVPELLHRIRRDRADRPLVRDLSLAELETFVRDLLQQREPYYLQADSVLQGPATVPKIVGLLLR